ncbi:flagellar assembly protein FliW [Paenibacillus oleatilyticus]|uniref:flagellar assembly protein FliW n=1 Tax=Paenibacillus oleatilyticus TaxID=2594886 RepID=UPI001C1FBE7F|nr:flagellar assembly protein FliW [Paenibacillus oleatilyticus]MBU7317598.1 flagellar assembly protein FliW [Paenibacillus oleatilyticus]
MLEQMNGKAFNLNSSILGFENYNQYELQHIEGTEFAYFQSLDDENIGFVVGVPFVHFKDYTFELSQDDIDQLALSSEEEALVLCIVTVKEPFENSTMNLMAPIIINIQSLNGRQIVLPPKYEYDIKTPLFDKSNK